MSDRGGIRWRAPDGTFLRLESGTLDLGVFRDRDAAWGGKWRWWKRFLPRPLWERFGYVPVDWSAFLE